MTIRTYAGREIEPKYIRTTARQMRSLIGPRPMATPINSKKQAHMPYIMDWPVSLRKIIIL